MTKLQLLRSEVFLAARDYSDLLARGDLEGLASLSFVLRLNNLKLSASQLTVEVVSEALFACGIGSYMNKSPFSLSRQLRDAYSAPLMINNDRIHETNASILSVFKGE